MIIEETTLNTKVKEWDFNFLGFSIITMEKMNSRKKIHLMMLII